MSRAARLAPAAAVLAVPAAVGAVGVLLVGAITPTQIPGSGAAACAGSITVTGSGALSTPMRPGSYTLTSPFGPRAATAVSPAQFHAGQDFAAPDGTPIYAAQDGDAVAGPAAGFGLWIVITGTVNGQTVSTVYGHENDGGLLVRTGQHVTAGQQIGLVGHNGQATGPHLHFEVWAGGRFTGGRAVDPLGWLNLTGAAPPAAAPPLAVAPVALTPGVTLTMTPERSANAAAIVSVAKATFPDPATALQAAVVGIATAMQESTLLNLPYGDRDSLGLFQQRPSAGWGTPAQILQPAYAATQFFTHLARVPGWQAMPVTVAAQTVQASAYPDAYAKWVAQARALVAANANVPPGVIPAPAASACGTPTPGGTQ